MGPAPLSGSYSSTARIKRMARFWYTSSLSRCAALIRERFCLITLSMHQRYSCTKELRWEVVIFISHILSFVERVYPCEDTPSPFFLCSIFHQICGKNIDQITHVDDDIIFSQLLKFLLAQYMSGRRFLSVIVSQAFRNDTLPFRKKFLRLFYVVLLSVKLGALLPHSAVRLNLQRIVTSAVLPASPGASEGAPLLSCLDAGGASFCCVRSIAFLAALVPNTVNRRMTEFRALRIYPVFQAIPFRFPPVLFFCLKILFQRVRVIKLCTISISACKTDDSLDTAGTANVRMDSDKKVSKAHVKITWHCTCFYFKPRCGPERPNGKLPGFLQRQPDSAWILFLSRHFRSLLSQKTRV